MPSVTSSEKLRGLHLSAADLRTLTDWPQPVIEDYLNILDNLISLGENVDTNTDNTQLIHELIAKTNRLKGHISNLISRANDAENLIVSNKKLNSAISALNSKYDSLSEFDALITSKQKALSGLLDSNLNDYLQYCLTPKKQKNPFHPVPYGSMYMFQGSTTITVSVANTWYELQSGLSAGANLWEMVFGESHYIYAEITGIYEVVWSAAAASNVSNAIMGAITINSADDTAAIAATSQAAKESASHNTVAVGGDYAALSGNVSIALSENDQISLVFLNESAANDIEIQHVNLTAKFIGEQ